MRMLFRRHDWIPASSLNYTEVGDINVALKELLDRRFIVDSMVLEFIIIIHHHHLTPSKYCAFGLCLQHIKVGWIPDFQMLKSSDNKTLKFFADNSEESLHGLLKMMPLPRLKKICMEMKIGMKTNRPEIINAMLKHASQQTVSSMLKSSFSTEQAMIKRCSITLPTHSFLPSSSSTHQLIVPHWRNKVLCLRGNM